MTRKRTLEFSAIAIFALAGISFAMYVTAVAEWLILLPLMAAGLLSFAIWQSIANESVRANPVSTPLDKVSVTPGNPVVQFTLEDRQLSSTPASIDEERAA
jgi:hypothetical protein